MSEHWPYNEIEMWHGHPDLYMNELEEIKNNSDDSAFGYFLEVDVKYPDKKKGKKNFHFVLKRKLFLKINIMIFWKR